MDKSKGAANHSAARHGAGAFAFEKLVDAQRSAWDKAVGILSNIAEAVDDPEARSGRRPNDRELSLHSVLVPYTKARPSQVILFDAGRGAGKSSLLFTLCEESRRLALAATGARDATESTVNDDRSRAVLSRCFALPTLDMHPLPPTRPLLAYMLLSFGQLRSRLIGSHSTRDAGPWLASTQSETVRELEGTWRRLSEAADAYDTSGVRSRAGDSLVEAQDMLDAAAAAGTLNERFEWFIDAIAKATAEQFGFKKKPIFLLPIDDADMNDARAYECIEILRGLYHPQVVFVLAGHSELFLTRLRTVAAAQMRDLVADEREAQARTSAFELYDRVIPPAHRCEIEPLSRRERLFTAVGQATEGESIASLLARPGDSEDASGLLPHLMRIDVEPTAKDTTAPTKKGAKRAAKTVVATERYIRRTATALPERLRGLLNLSKRLADLQRAYQAHVREDEGPWTTGEVAIEQALRIWEEATDYRFSPSEKSVLDDITRWVYRERGDRSEIGLQSIGWQVAHRPVGYLGPVHAPTHELLSSRITGASLRINENRSVPLDERQCAALTLLIDAVEEHRPGSVLFAQLPWARDREWFVVANVTASDGVRRRIPWPVPEWRSLNPANSFVARWEILSRAGALGSEEQVARWYVALIALSSVPWQMRRRGRWSEKYSSIALVEQWESAFAKEGDERKKALAVAPTWDELAKIVEWCFGDTQKRESADSNTRALSDWVKMRLPALFAPEGGLSAGEVERALESALGKLEQWKELGPSINEARALRLGELSVGPIAVPSDRWSRVFLPRPVFDSSDVLRALKDISFSKPVLGVNEPTPLSWYYSGLTSMYLERFSPQAKEIVQDIVFSASRKNDEDVLGLMLRLCDVVIGDEHRRRGAGKRSSANSPLFEPSVQFVLRANDSLLHESEVQYLHVEFAAAHPQYQLFDSFVVDTAAAGARCDVRESVMRLGGRFEFDEFVRWPGYRRRMLLGDERVEYGWLCPMFACPTEFRLLVEEWNRRLDIESARNRCHTVSLLLFVLRLCFVVRCEMSGKNRRGAS